MSRDAWDQVIDRLILKQIDCGQSADDFIRSHAILPEERRPHILVWVCPDCDQRQTEVVSWVRRFNEVIEREPRTVSFHPRIVVVNGCLDRQSRDELSRSSVILIEASVKGSPPDEWESAVRESLRSELRELCAASQATMPVQVPSAPSGLNNPATWQDYVSPQDHRAFEEWMTRLGAPWEDHDLWQGES